MLKVVHITASFLMVALLIGMVADRVCSAEMAVTPAVLMSANCEMPDCDMCDGGDEAAMVCAIYCSSNSASAMALSPAPIEMFRPNGSEVEIVIVRLPAGLGAPPDPFPPETSVQS